jgi:hypothetical protein
MISGTTTTMAKTMPTSMAWWVILYSDHLRNAVFFTTLPLGTPIFGGTRHVAELGRRWARNHCARACAQTMAKQQGM